MDSESGKISYKVVVDTSAMEAERNQVELGFERMGKKAEAEGAKIDNAFSGAAAKIGKAFAALTAVSTFTNLARKIMAVRGEFQQLEVAFETMLGSAKEADSLMSQLVKTAATTPFGLQEVAGGAKQLLAYGIAADEVNDTLVRLGDIAAGLSIPLNDLVYLYGTTMTQGRLYTQDMRQFMGRGIPLAEELAKQFGVTKDKVSELVTEGKVGFPQVKQAIIDLTSTGGKFGGLMEKQSHTITGQISNIEDALDMMFNDLGKSSEGVINAALSSVSYVIEHYEQFGKVLLTIVAMWGEYKAALMVAAAYQSLMTKQISLQTAATTLATKAVNALKLAWATNPVGIILAAITAVIGAISLFTSNTEEATDALHKFRDAAMDDQSKLETYRGAILALDKTAKGYKDSVAGLKALAEQYGVTITNEKGEIEDQQKAYESLTKAISKHAAEKVLVEQASEANKNAMEAEKEAMDKLMSSAKNAERIISTHVDAYGNVTHATEALASVQQISEASWAMVSQQVMAHAKDIADAYAQSEEAGKQAANRQVAEIERMMKAYGASDEDIKDFHNSLVNYVNETAKGFQAAYSEMNRAEMQLRGLAGETNKFAEETANLKGVASDTYETLKTKQDDIQAKIDAINANPMSPEVDTTGVQTLLNMLHEVQQLMGQNITKGSLGDLKKRQQDLRTQRDALRGVNDKEADKIDKQVEQVSKRITELEGKNYESRSRSSGGRTGGRTGGRRTGGGVTIDKKQIAYDVKSAQKELADAVKNLQDQLTEAINDATIAAMKEGATKQLEQIKDDTKDKLKALDDEIKQLMEKQREEEKQVWLKQNPKKKEYDYKTPAEESIDQFLQRYPDLLKLYTQRKAQIEQAGADATNKVTDAQRKAETDAMNAYLAEYGTYTQKRKAIIDDYNAKIAKATTEGEKQALSKQMTDALGELDFNKLKDSMDWGIIFGDLSKIASDELKKVRKQLIDLTKSTSFKNYTPEQVKVIEDAIHAIDEQMVENGGFFGNLTESMRNYKLAVDEVAAAQDRLNNATTEAEREAAQKALRQAKENKITAATNRDKAVDKTINNIEAVMGAIERLGSSSEASLTDLGAATASITEAFGKAAGKIGGIIGAIFSLLDAIQKQGFDKFVDNIFKSVFGAVGGIFQTLFGKSSLWGSTYDADLINQLTASNSALEYAITKLTNTMEDQAGSDAVKTYEQAVKDIEQSMLNTQQIMQSTGKAYSNGFFGIGGKRSANAHIADALTTTDWGRLTTLIGRTISSASDLWSLTSEEMGKIASSAPDIWGKIQSAAKDGYQDVSEYMDSYIEYYDRLIELQNEYNETLTAASFDNIKSGLESLLMDTKTDAADVIKSVSDMMQKAIVNLVLTKSMQPRLQKWYESFAQAMADDTLTAMESAALQQGYADIYKQAKDEVNKAYELAGIDPNRTNSDAEGSSGSWASLGEETGRSIDGRLTAIHIQTTRIADMIVMENEAINRIDLRSMQQYSMLSEMSNLVYISAGHLERIARNSDSLPSINTKLEKIRQNTDRL